MFSSSGLHTVAAAVLILNSLFPGAVLSQDVSEAGDGQVHASSAFGGHTRPTFTTTILPSASTRPGPPPKPHEIKDNHGAVASENKICSDIGLDLLKAGGNAADALVGTVFCVGVTGMYHSGVGGGGFMLVRSSNGSFEFIDFRETAPAAAFETMYSEDDSLSLYGGLASGVPGELRGLEHLHKGYGKLPWKDVIAPAVKLARYGFPVNKDTVRYIASAISGIDNFLVHDPAWAIDFAPNGTLVGLGDRLTRKRYANTLETIGEYGPDAFYTGAIADATITALRKANGTMTLDDLKNYTVAIRKPAEITYKGYKIHACSAPSGGEVVLAALKIFEGYDGADPTQLNASVHYLDESMKFAYGERTQLGDPSFLPNLTEYQASMLSEATAAEIRTKIRPNETFTTSYYDPSGIETLTDAGTSQVVVSDASGMAISLTTTINTLFGSRVIVPETGVILNNEMNDFSIPGVTNAFGYIPSEANYIRPGKRPLSSISPTIVETAAGALYYIIGSAGGSRIITATIQNIWHVLDQKLTAEQALAQPRMHDQLTPATVSFEYAGLNIQGYDNSTVAYLAGLGANVSWIAPGQTTAQGIVRLPNGTFQAAGEPRQYASGGLAY